MMLTPLGRGVTRGHLVHRRIIVTIAVLEAGVGTEAIYTRGLVKGAENTLEGYPRQVCTKGRVTQVKPLN